MVRHHSIPLTNEQENSMELHRQFLASDHHVPSDDRRQSETVSSTQLDKLFPLSTKTSGVQDRRTPRPTARLLSSGLNMQSFGTIAEGQAEVEVPDDNEIRWRALATSASANLARGKKALSEKTPKTSSRPVKLSKKDRDADVASFAVTVNSRDNIPQADKDATIELYRRAHRTTKEAEHEEKAEQRRRDEASARLRSVLDPVVAAVEAAKKKNKS
jgi:hypothetical protein